MRDLQNDIYGGLTAGIVALPLALALGVASGLGPMAGLYGAIILGFFAALFGGTASQISGPTGPMVVVIAGLFASLSGDVELVLTAIMLAGLLQIIFGVTGVGQYIRLVPYPVVSGFMTGIGAIIIILQIGRLLGHEPPSGTLPALMYIPTALKGIDFNALIIGVVTLAIALRWPVKWGKYIPAPLAALAIGTFIGVVFLSAPALGKVPSGFPDLHMPVFDQKTALLVFEAAIILAVLGSIDSLLTSLVADNMTRTRHDSNRELIGQGIGNTITGLFGGVAGAGATMRTVVNIRAGGKTRRSGMIHALVLLVIVAAFAPYAAQIPHAALAGLLVKVGIDIIDWSYLKRSHRGPRWDLLLMALVFGLTVFVDLITAVAVGVVLASLAFLRKLGEAQIESIKVMPEHLDNEQEVSLMAASKGRINVFDFGGPLSFGAAADLGHRVRLHDKKETEAIILDFSRVPFMDVSAAIAVETIAIDAKLNGNRLYLSGVHGEVQGVMESFGLLDRLHNSGVFDERAEALKQALYDFDDFDDLYDLYDFDDVGIEKEGSLLLSPQANSRAYLSKTYASPTNQ